MPLLRRTLLPLVATALTLGVAAPAAAAPPPAAQAFVDAVRAAEVEAQTAVPAVKPAVDRLRPCVRMAVRAPERANDHAVTYAISATLSELLPLLVPIYQRLEARLDAVVTADPALRRGRAAWRAAQGSLRGHPSGRALCTRLKRWRATGWKASARPRLPDLEESDAATRRDERHMCQASRRLRALGIPPADARAFRGAGIIEPLADAYADAMNAALDRGHSVELDKDAFPFTCRGRETT